MDKFTIKFQGFDDTKRSYLIVTDIDETDTFVLKGVDAEKYFEKLLSIIVEIEEKA